MIAALQAAGFAGVEDVGGVIHARLTAVSGEFTVTAVADGWQAALCWPVRATVAQMAGWTAAHPRAPMDIWQGETRIVMQVAPQDLALWAALAEEMVARCVRWRRMQRAPGEGN
ncbi:MAG: hypothetical protein V4712_09620 [Pseudomonadota bacterium]